MQPNTVPPHPIFSNPSSSSLYSSASYPPCAPSAYSSSLSPCFYPPAASPSSSAACTSYSPSPSSFASSSAYPRSSSPSCPSLSVRTSSLRSPPSASVSFASAALAAPPQGSASGSSGGRETQRRAKAESKEASSLPANRRSPSSLSPVSSVSALRDEGSKPRPPSPRQRGRKNSALATASSLPRHAALKRPRSEEDREKEREGSSVAAPLPALGPSPHRQTLPFFSLQQHPHDQHARHGTYGIIARGVCEREKSEDAGNKRGRQNKTPQLRDDRPFVCFSWRYRDAFLTLSTDRLVVTGHKGWSSAFATHCSEKDKWYFEVEVLPCETQNLRFIGYSQESLPPLKAHWRVGWACRYQTYDVPIGGNLHSFALCGACNETPMLATGGLKRRLAGEASCRDLPLLKEGDIIGCFLTLHEPRWWLPDPRKDPKLHEFLQAGILCSPDAQPPCVVNEGAWIEFSVNGERLGRVFEGMIGNGVYHPAVSLYMGAKLRLNPGPNFSFPPPPSEGFQPCSEMRRPHIP
ncbi:SPRY domain-containing protein [Toxoplasma gondii ME49]|uniref:SPRY domain-containing protein n=2 Tax=Toxoplasma gondii TaxID=5811 RepID=S8FAZ8_TOXGM|nr:SPRY domain-containing protein [Toxoplasma gondii ME49]EPT31982.1 SPRY domain-containing protein [Toxoplasma gondii ME49]|eukprot:XP_018638267.1 SPRY domain-containing protein [Toxoplasma gondii ME49]